MKTNLTTENVENLTSYIGNRWTKKGDRLYLTDAFMLSAVGLEYECYKTGNIASATLNGEKISNSKAGKIASFLRFAKIYVDLETGELVNAGEYAEMIAAAVNAALPAEKEKEEEKEDARPDVEMISELLEEMASPRVTFKKSCLFGKTYKVAVFVDGEFVREVVAFAAGKGLSRQELALEVAAAVDDHDKTADLSEKKTLEVLRHYSYTYESWTDYASKIDVVPSDEVYVAPAVYCDALEKLDLSAVDANRAYDFPVDAWTLFFALRYLQNSYSSCRRHGAIHIVCDDLSVESLTDSLVVGLCESLGLPVECYGDAESLQELLHLRGWVPVCTGSIGGRDTVLYKPGLFIDPETVEPWSVYKPLSDDLYTETVPVDYGFDDVKNFYDGAVRAADLPHMDPLRWRLTLVQIGSFAFAVVKGPKCKEVAIFQVSHGKKWLSAETLFETAKKYLKD